MVWSAPIAMGLSRNRIIEDANQALCSAMGYAHAELVGQSIQIFYESRQEFDRIGRLKYPLLARQGWAGSETRWCRKDGTVLDVMITSARIDPADLSAGLIFVMTDISNRKQAERELTVQNARWFDLFDNSPEGIVLLDPDFRIVMANNEFARMFGYSKQDLLNRYSPAVVIPPEREHEGQDAVERLQRGETVRIAQTLRCGKDGSRIPVSILSKPIRVDGNTIGIYGIYRDISAQVRAEQEIRDSLHEKEVLLQEIHHRVKNNLNIISSLLSLQQSAAEDDSYQQPLEVAKARVHAMAMIHDLLYRSESLAQVPFRNYLQDLVHYLRDAYHSLRERVDISLDVDEICLDIATSIPCGLLVNEIVVNSMKHAFPDGRRGTIAVHFQQKHNSYVLRVSDNGVGPPSGLDFMNAHSVGMELIRGLSTQLGAQLQWDFSAGSAYTVTIPIKQAQREAPA